MSWTLWHVKTADPAMLIPQTPQLRDLAHLVKHQS